MCTIVLWTKVAVEFIAIKKPGEHRQNAMRVALKKLFPASRVPANIVFLSNTVPNSFGISNKLLLGTSD